MKSTQQHNLALLDAVESEDTASELVDDRITTIVGDEKDLHDIAKEWDANVPERANELELNKDITYSQVINPLIGELLLLHCTHKASILDVGCGLGFVTDRIHDTGYQVSGIDISRQSIAYAKTYFPHIKFCNSSIVSFSKNHEGQFNVCVANMVFHNLPRLDDNFQAIARMLSSDGVLIMSIPHPLFWESTRPFPHLFSGFSYLQEYKVKVPFRIRDGQTHKSPITYYHRSQQAYFQSAYRAGFINVDHREPNRMHGDGSTDLLFLVFRQRGHLQETESVPAAVLL